MNLQSALKWSSYFGIVEVLSCLIGIFIIEKLGRKKLLIISFGFQIICMFLMSILNQYNIKGCT